MWLRDLGHLSTTKVSSETIFILVSDAVLWLVASAQSPKGQTTTFQRPDLFRLENWRRWHFECLVPSSESTRFHFFSFCTVAVISLSKILYFGGFESSGLVKIFNFFVRIPENICFAQSREDFEHLLIAKAVVVSASTAADPGLNPRIVKSYWTFSALPFFLLNSLLQLYYSVISIDSVLVLCDIVAPTIACSICN